MAKWYGNITNRLEEGKNFTNRELRAGDDITEYMYSDRRCYYIDKVIDQKHIIVKPYFVTADKSKGCEIGHQDWLYFKSAKEFNDYINEHCKNLTIKSNMSEPDGIEWVYRYGNWYTISYESFGRKLTKPQYNRLNKVSFGVRDYYYDWEF